MSSTRNQVERILGCMNIPELRVLDKLLAAQITLQENQCMGGVYLPSLKDRVNRALVVLSKAQMEGRGTVDQKVENGVDYKIVVKSNDRVFAIKFIRELWNMGLKEAKDLFDKAWNPDIEWNELTVLNDTPFNKERASTLAVELTARRQGLSYREVQQTLFIEEVTQQTE